MEEPGRVLEDRGDRHRLLDALPHDRRPVMFEQDGRRAAQDFRDFVADLRRLHLNRFWIDGNLRVKDAAVVADGDDVRPAIVQAMVMKGWQWMTAFTSGRAL